MVQPANMYFADDGVLYNASDATTAEKIEALIQLLKLFNAGLASCGRTDSGDYCLIDKHSGYRGGLQVLWKKITSLALLLHFDSYHGLTEEEQKIVAETGTVVRNPKLRFNATPLADLVYRIAFAIPWESSTKWVKEIPNQTGQQLRATFDELLLYHEVAAREEEQPPAARGEVDKSTWPTRAQLRIAVGISKDTVRSMLKAAGLFRDERGSDAHKTRFSPDEVLKLRQTVRRGDYLARQNCWDAWMKWSTLDPTDPRPTNPECKSKVRR
ncbi:MAG: hypothetical protein KF812_11490 [Fimbriimonadaceae bacterium]|nr:hypothetical protein [Fimbriimonadaceae bacterium]